MKENILVTGGAGFIGTALVKELFTRQYNIFVLDDYSSGFKPQNHIPGVTYIEGHTVKIEKYFKDININVVFHLGEYSRIATSFDDIERVWKSNSCGTFHVVNFCKKRNAKIIYAGSSTRFAEEGVNHSPYSYTKSNGAELIKNYFEWYGLKYAICYFYNVFGYGYDSSSVPGYESVVSVFEKQYKADKSLTICGSGYQRRAFTYVNDIVAGLLKAWKYNKNEEFQLNNTKEYSILEIAKMFSNNIIYVDDRPGDRATSITTNNNARELLNWETTMDINEWIDNIKNGGNE